MDKINFFDGSGDDIYECLKYGGVSEIAKLIVKNGESVKADLSGEYLRGTFEVLPVADVDLNPVLRADFSLNAVLSENSYSVKGRGTFSYGYGFPILTMSRFLWVYDGRSGEKSVQCSRPSVVAVFTPLPRRVEDKPDISLHYISALKADDGVECPDGFVKMQTGELRGGKKCGKSYFVPQEPFFDLDDAAFTDVDSSDGEMPTINLYADMAGSKKLRSATKQIIASDIARGKRTPIGVVVDGKLVSTPVIMSEIGNIAMAICPDANFFEISRRANRYLISRGLKEAAIFNSGLGKLGNVCVEDVDFSDADAEEVAQYIVRYAEKFGKKMPVKISAAAEKSDCSISLTRKIVPLEKLCSEVSALFAAKGIIFKISEEGEIIMDKYELPKPSVSSATSGQNGAID